MDHGQVLYGSIDRYCMGHGQALYGPIDRYCMDHGQVLYGPIDRYCMDYGTDSRQVLYSNIVNLQVQYSRCYSTT